MHLRSMEISTIQPRNDAELIHKIISLVLTNLSLSKNSVNSKGLIGIDKKIAHVKSLISKRLEDTRIIGMWGMGGIGKTTIAEELFNKLHSEYDGGCFLRNVREESTRHGMLFLKEKLFSSLLAEDVKVDTFNGLPDHVERRVRHMKVLIVLDDVNGLDQVEILVGDGDWFRLGSRVIITTRDKQVLAEEDIYDVGALDLDEALELFNLNAFKQNYLKMEEYFELSKKVVSYAKGIPLVLKVLGHLLRGKDKKVWGSQLNKIVKMPLKKVYDALKLSYDDLDRKEQNIFLNLACFFVGLKSHVGFIKALLKEGENDDSLVVGLERLKDRALITISKNDLVSMHDIIQEMAWEIVFDECPEDPGRRSRLWDPDDICEVLKYDKGSEAIKSLRLPWLAVEKLKLSPHIFAKMSKLQFLYASHKYDQDDIDLLPQGLQFLPTELRYIGWMHYPLKSLPEKFSAEKLVILDLSYSKLERLWHGVKNLVNLKEVQLHSSRFLKELPDFSKATNLQVLNTSKCRQLTNVHPSIFSLEKLDELDLSICYSLSGLPSKIHLRSLSYLRLQGSRNISEFSITISHNMIELNLQSTRVIALAASFGSQAKLEKLHLAFCYYIESLPSCFNILTKLTFLDIRGCRKLKTIPELPSSLEILLAEGCTLLETISSPSNVEQSRENRKMVEFWNCLKLDEHSLVDIGLNAQINMMKFSCKHLPANNEHLPAHNEYYASFQAEYVYPGSSVPEWFVYKTTEDYIVIDHSAPYSPILGFIFCFILCEFDYLVHTRLKFNITVCDDEGDGGIGDSVEMYCSEPLLIESDHVCVIYNERCSQYLNVRAKNVKRYEIKATAGRWDQRVGLRGFGIYPINTTTAYGL